MKVVALIFLVFGFATAGIIDTIVFVGNQKTKDSYLQGVVSHISKTEYAAKSDTAIFKALERTGLFSEIAVVPSQSSQSGDVSVFVILKERGNFSFSDIGGGFNSTLYGDPSGTWLVFNFSAVYNNLFGINQRLRFRGQIWQDRYLGIDYLIPVGASQYFFDVGAFVGRRPSLVFPWELSPYFNTNLGFGRRIGDNQLLYLETSPRYRKYNLLKREFDYFGRWKVWDSDDFWEIYQRLYYRFSMGDGDYPPLFASFAGVGLSTNKIMANENNEHWELSADLKQNIPVSHRARHSFLLRFRPKLTISGERDKYSGLLTGGQDFLRGWGCDILGSRDSVIFNNLLLGTLEYQFHIYTFPAMRMFGWLSWYDKSMKEFSPQLVGALFLDGGHLFKDISSLKESPHNTGAASAGVSIRLLQCRMRLGGQIDFAWQIAGNEKYLNTNRSVPNIHLGFVSQF